MCEFPHPPPSYPLADALAPGDSMGVPWNVREEAKRAHALDLTRDDGPPIRFLLDPWPPGPGGTWTAKRHARGRTFTGYAGGHAPRGGGVPGLSAAGIRRALDGLDRQERRWATGEAAPRPPYRPCPTCNRPMPLADMPPAE